MVNKTDQENRVVEAIRRQVKIFNLITVLVVYSLFFFVVRFLYVILDYVSTPSLVAIASIIAGLVVIGMYVANASSRSAISHIEEYSRKLGCLLSTTKDITQTEYIDVLLERIVDSSMKITAADSCAVLLNDGGKLVYKVTRGAENSRELAGLAIPKSSGIAGWTVEHLIPLRIDDPCTDARYDGHFDALIGPDTKSLLCVPLVMNSMPVGALEIIKKGSGSFSADDETLLSYFADQAATAVTKAKFYEDQKNYEINLTDILVNTLDNYYSEKSGHSRRVARYSLLMAKALNMSEAEQKRLYRASLLHDVGFLRMKPGSMKTKEQFAAHSELGYEVLRPINFYADIAPIILHHHERYDGGGYPERLQGEAIPIESRIIAIAEAFDAMASSDSYRYVDQALPSSFLAFQFAVEELKNNAATQFDPELVGIFVNNIDESSLQEASQLP